MDFKLFPHLKEIQQFNASLLERVSALPGVESATIAGNHPLDAGFTNSFAVIGRESGGERLAGDLGAACPLRDISGRYAFLWFEVD